MSQNRKYRRAIRLDKHTEALVRQDKAVAHRIYFDWKHEVKIKQFTQLELRESIMEAMKKIRAGCKTDYARIAYGRAFLIMLNKVGGPTKDADDLFDEAMGKKEDGPTEESIREAMKILGMEPPDASDNAAGLPSVTPSPSPLTGAADDPPTPPRFRRTYPADPPAE